MRLYITFNEIHKELVDELELYHIIKTGQFDVVLSTVSNNDIEINNDKFDKYCLQYLESYIRFNVLFSKLISLYVPDEVYNVATHVSFSGNRLYVESNNDFDISILKKFGYIEVIS